MIKYSSDKKQMREYVTLNKERFSNVDKLIYGAISIFLDNRSYLGNIEDKIKTEKGGFDMCLAFEQMIEEGKIEGREEGRIKKATESAKVALELGLAIEQVAQISGLSIEEVESLKD